MIFFKGFYDLPAEPVGAAAGGFAGHAGRVGAVLDELAVLAEIGGVNQFFR